MGKVKFVFNRQAFSDQVLKSDRIQRHVHEAAEQAVGSDLDKRIIVRDQTEGKTRNGVAVIVRNPKDSGGRAKLDEVIGGMRI